MDFAREDNYSPQNSAHLHEAVDVSAVTQVYEPVPEITIYRRPSIGADALQQLLPPEYVASPENEVLPEIETIQMKDSQPAGSSQRAGRSQSVESGQRSQRVERGQRSYRVKNG